VIGAYPAFRDPKVGACSYLSIPLRSPTSVRSPPRLPTTTQH